MYKPLWSDTLAACGRCGQNAARVRGSVPLEPYAQAHRGAELVVVEVGIAQEAGIVVGVGIGESAKYMQVRIVGYDLVNGLRPKL